MKTQVSPHREDSNPPQSVSGPSAPSLPIFPDTCKFIHWGTNPTVGNAALNKISLGEGTEASSCSVHGQCILPWAQLCGEGWEPGPPEGWSQNWETIPRNNSPSSHVGPGVPPMEAGTSSRGGCSQPSLTLPLSRETTKPSPSPHPSSSWQRNKTTLIFITPRFPRKVGY